MGCSGAYGYYDSMNMYSYVTNNPLNWVDPYGLSRLFINVKERRGFGLGDFGHAWVTLEDEAGNRTSYGFWPARGAGHEAKDGRYYEGEILRYPGDSDTGTMSYDARYEIDITESEYDDLMEFMRNRYNHPHNWGLKNNCTDFAHEVADEVGESIPETNFYKWSDPNGLSNWIKRQQKRGRTR